MKEEKGHKSCALQMVFRRIKLTVEVKKVGGKHIQQNTVNAIVFKLQLIYSTVRISKQLLLSYAISCRSANLLSQWYM